MQVTYYKEYSYHLDSDMEYKVFGHGGKPVIVFPCQDGRFFDFENRGMIETVRGPIEEGRLMLVCVDSIDKWTWSLLGQDESKRIELHERWFRYITDEVVKRIYEINPYDGKIATSGCSMGATHALNFFLRRPDIFDGVIGLSGVYHASFFFPNYHDSRIYDNSITDYMANMPSDHPYLNLYRQSDIILCIGTGRWENDGIPDMHFLEKRFKELGVPVWFDYWGNDVDHDWPWWMMQFPYFISYII